MTHRPFALLKRVAAFAALAFTLASSHAQGLPPEVLTALTRANVPADSIAVLGHRPVPMARAHRLALPGSVTAQGLP